jgi:hypothetical protein
MKDPWGIARGGRTSDAANVDAVEVVTEKLAVGKDTSSNTFQWVYRLEVPCGRAGLDSSRSIFLKQVKFGPLEGMLI